MNRLEYSYTMKKMIIDVVYHSYLSDRLRSMDGALSALHKRFDNEYSVMRYVRIMIPRS